MNAYTQKNRFFGDTNTINEERLLFKVSLESIMHTTMSLLSLGFINTIVLPKLSKYKDTDELSMLTVQPIKPYNTYMSSNFHPELVSQLFDNNSSQLMKNAGAYMPIANNNFYIKQQASFSPNQPKAALESFALIKKMLQSEIAYQKIKFHNNFHRR